MHNRLGRVTLALLLACTLALGLFLGLGQHLVQAESSESPFGRYDTPPTPPAPERDFPVPSLSKTGKPSATVSDLSIHFISRMPRYERYCLDYTNDVPQLCESTEKREAFPRSG